MKHTLWIFLAMIISISIAYSQDIVKEGYVWNYYEPPAFGPNSSTISIMFSDTVNIQGLIYHKMWYTYDSLEMNVSWADSYRYFREDGNGKVLEYNPNGEEIVWYDFNLEIGDLFYIPKADLGGENIYYYEVVDIDSIQLSNGEFKKRYQFDAFEINFFFDDTFNITNEWYIDYWIEEIGSNYHLFKYNYAHLIDGNPPIFLCYSDESLLLYSNPDYEGCYISDVSAVQPTSFQMYPNPAFNLVTIETKYPIEEVNFYNVQGALVLNSKVRNIDIDGLKSGLFTVQVIYKNSKTDYRKLIIQK